MVGRSHFCCEATQRALRFQALLPLIIKTLNWPTDTMYDSLILSGFAALSLLGVSTSSPVERSIERRAPAPFTDFTKNIVWYPASDAVQWKTLYARTLQLADNSLLITWENYPKEPPLVTHKVLRSTDGGATFSDYSEITDQVNGWGMRFQPFLWTLPVDFGGFAAGTILASGVSCPYSLNGGVYIELYASTDQAQTWEFVSHIAYGDGPETITNGDKAIWEPFLLFYNGQVVVYYSDQTDSAHSQKLVHKTTSDLHTWSDSVPDVAYSLQSDRPGMTTVAHIESTDKWIMTFEYCGSGNCNVHYKVADSPLLFDQSEAIQLQANDTGVVPTNGPYVTWTQHPGRTDGSGLIIASGTNREEVFVNEDSADSGGWKSVNINHWSAYSRSLRIVDIQGVKKLMLGNGGNFGGENSIADAVVPIPT